MQLMTLKLRGSSETWENWPLMALVTRRRACARAQHPRTLCHRASGRLPPLWGGRHWACRCPHPHFTLTQLVPGCDLCQESKG